jgi:hypothetical protein
LYQYTTEVEADIEDMLGREVYTTLVEHGYNLKRNEKFPQNRPADASKRVVKEVETHFLTLPPNVPEFSHLIPA